LVNLNFSRGIKNEGATVLFNLITECTLSFSFIFYYIQKKRTKFYKEDWNLSIRLRKSIGHENINRKEFFFCPNKSKKKFIFMCIFTSSVKFFYAFFFFFFTNYLCKQNMKDLMLNIHMIPGIFFMYYLSKNILKRNYYKHHILMIIIIPLISIPLSFLNFIMYKVEIKNEVIKIYNYLFYSSLLFFFTMLMYVCYKYIMEKYFVSIYLLNCYEGIILTIYTILFYYLYLKKEYGDKPMDEIKNNYKNLVYACICNLIVNLLIKYIIYIFDEMYEIIPNYGEIIIKIISFWNEKNLINNNFLYKILFSLQILLYILILFCICVLFEIIILHVCDLHTHTKKYLNILQNEEKKFLELIPNNDNN
jgi:hypothetical protein